MSHLLQKHKESGTSLFRDRNAFYAFSTAFQNMLKDTRLLPVYFAVDALDECMQGRSDLIHLISTSLTLSQNVKWLLSSRPEVDLLAELRDPATHSPGASDTLIELDTQRLVDPVNAYIDHKLKALQRKKDTTIAFWLKYHVKSANGQGTPFCGWLSRLKFSRQCMGDTLSSMSKICLLAYRSCMII